MSEELDEKISTYAKHFRDQLQRLSDYEFSPQDNVLKKNILVSMLDTIARTTPEFDKGNCKRFTYIVANFGEWHDHTRVSAPHVSYLLANLSSHKYDAARDHITEIIARNSDGSFVQLSNDPELEELREVWPVPVDQNVVNKLSLQSLTHLNLLYKYRNSLVHELREPGYGMEFHDDHQAPFYHGMTTINADGFTEGETLELVYPLNFYFRLTETIINNVESFLRENKIDPYTFYQFGSSWIGELNSD